MRWWLCLALCACACDELHGLDPEVTPLARVAFAVTGDPAALGIADDVPLYAALIWQARATPDRFCTEHRDDPDPVRQRIIALGCVARDFAPTEIASEVLVPRAALDGRTLWLPVLRLPLAGPQSAVAAVVVYAASFGTPSLELFSSGDPYSAIATRDVVLAASTVPNNTYEVIVLRARNAAEPNDDCGRLLGGFEGLRSADRVAYGFSRITVAKDADGVRCKTARLTSSPIRLTLARSKELNLARCYGQLTYGQFPSQTNPPDWSSPWTCLGPSQLVRIDDRDADCDAITQLATSGCYNAAVPCDEPDYTVDTPTWWPCAGAAGEVP